MPATLDDAGKGTRPAGGREGHSHGGSIYSPYSHGAGAAEPEAATRPSASANDCTKASIRRREVSYPPRRRSRERPPCGRPRDFVRTSYRCKLQKVCPRMRALGFRKWELYWNQFPCATQSLSLVRPELRAGGRTVSTSRYTLATQQLRRLCTHGELLASARAADVPANLSVAAPLVRTRDARSF